MAADTNVEAVLQACHAHLRLSFDDKIVPFLASDPFRNIIGCCQKLSANPNSIPPPVVTDLVHLLLEILAECKLTFDNQILASTAFCLVFNLVQEPWNISLMFCQNIIPAGPEPFSLKLTKSSDATITVADSDCFKLCLCHGLLNLGDHYWSNDHLHWHNLMYSKMFPLLEHNCFQCTHLSLLSFKCLHSWLRKVNTCMKPSRRVPPKLLMRVMNIVIANWENPMSGVREQNSLILEQLLVTTEGTKDEQIPGYLKSAALLKLVLTEQSWMMKSKFFLLSVLLPKAGILKSLRDYKEDIVKGLLTSLAYTHLASAGAELYRVCLDSLSYEAWQQIFLQPILNLLISSQFTLQKQNVFNYWVPFTMKKYKGVLDLMQESLVTSGSNEDILLPIVCILKLGRKEGYKSMSWESISYSGPLFLLRALKHSNEMVRSHAFAVVCLSSKTSISPSDEEFHLVETFLSENINNDNSPLRQNMLNNFTSFLLRVRDACLQILKTKFHNDPSQYENRPLTRSMIFLEWLYNFLKGNLEVGSNYQRKFTSLEIYKIVLAYLSNDSSTESVPGQRKGSLKSEGHKVMKYAIAVGKWSFTSEHSREILLYCISDPAEDVRESAGYILSNYFKFSESETARFTDLYKKSIQLCSDMRFFHAESGALLLQVVTSLAYKNGGAIGLKALSLPSKEEKVASSLLNLVEAQSEELRYDLLRAASQGSPLHGLLKALARLTTDRNSPEFASFSREERLRLLVVMEVTVGHLLKVLSSKTSTISVYAPSFCEMGKAIESAVEESSVNIEESDQHQLSPAYQLVLNCIWLNLRICCTLASSLVLSYSLGDEEVERCWDITASVLRHCRHKGALEVAGSSLSKIAQYCLSCERLAEALEKSVLEPCLAHMMSSSEEMTQSSRGAGNVILIHKLLSADHRPNKPFLHITVPRLVSAMTSNNCDLPQVMHLLTFLIQESSLVQDMARYKHAILLNCLSNLSYPMWAVRSAALQLFGAIVPKLIGQRKRQEDDSGCTCYHLAYEELLYHAKPLVGGLVELLERAANSDNIQVHSELVPVLTLLSNLSVGLLTIIDRTLEGIFHKFVNSMTVLMSSRIYDVRRLAAKGNAWFCSSSQLASLIKTRVWKIVTFINDRSAENEIKSENELHGFLLNTKFLYRRYLDEKDGFSEFRDQLDQVRHSIEELKSVRNSPKVSFICRSVLAELTGFDDRTPAPRQVEETVALLNNRLPVPHLSIGIFQWASVSVNQIVEKCDPNELHAVVNTCLLGCPYSEVHRACLSGLKGRLRGHFDDVYLSILQILFEFLKTNLNETNDVFEVTLRVLSSCSTRVEFGHENVAHLTGDKFRNCSAVVPVLCGAKELVEYGVAVNVVSRLRTCCAPGSFDEDWRMNAGSGLKLLVPFMFDPSTVGYYDVKIMVWETAVTLVQDEDSRVRLTAAEFVARMAQETYTSSPYVALHLLFKEEFLVKLFPTEYLLQCLWSKLRCKPSEISSLEILSEGIVNPYEIGVPNIYEETAKIIDMAASTILSIVQRSTTSAKALIKQQVLPSLKETREHCFKFLVFGSDHHLANNVILNNDWYIVSKKLASQCKIISFINNTPEIDKDFEMLQCRFESCIEQMSFIGRRSSS